MSSVYIGVIATLLICLFGGVLRVLVGPDNANRMLALQLFGTIGVTLVIILAFLLEFELLINLALILTLLGSVTVIAFLKIAEHSEQQHGEER